MNTNNVSFIVDDKGNKTHAILPIESYNALVRMKNIITQGSSLSTNEVYTLSLKGILARGYPIGNRQKPNFIVQKDSIAALQFASSVPDNIKDFRETLVINNILKLDIINNCYIFMQDVKFQSASFAATLIAGNIRNGLDLWINREGFSLKESGYGPKKLAKKSGKTTNGK